jgi:hypothetical protein
MRCALGSIILSMLLGTAFAAPARFQSPLDIIKKEGRLVIVDGSSYYALDHDGKFHSGPLGMSGRTIEGTWKHDGSLFVVQGQWSWINGVSAKDDRRTMRFAISGLLAVSTAKSPQLLPPYKGRPSKVHDCYFIIDELVRLKK